MKTLTANFTTEKDKRGTTPLSLLEVDLPSPLGTIQLAGHNIDLPVPANIDSWGALDNVADFDIESAGDVNTYVGLVKNWPDRIYSRISGDIHTPDISDVRIALVNTGDGDMAPFMRYLRAVDIEGAEARIYQYFSGLVSGDRDQLFTGTVRGPIEWNEETFSFDIVAGVSRDRTVGDKVLTSDYPSADLDDVGRVKPMVYGTIEKFPCLAVGIGAYDMLREDLAAAATTVKLSDASRFPASGNIIIGADTIAYTGKSGNDLTGATGVLAHKKGDVVWESRATYDFLVAGHAVKAITDVRVNDLLIPAADYTLDLANGLIKFSAHPVNQFLSEHIHDSASSGTSNKEQYADSGPANARDGNPNTGTNISTGSITLGWPNTSYGTIDTVHWWVMLSNTSPSDGSARIRRDYDGGPVLADLTVPASSAAAWYRVTDAGAAWSSDIWMIENGQNQNVFVNDCKRIVEYTATISETGKQIPGLDFWRGALVTCKVDGKKDDGSGTITGTPSALIERPDHVFKDFLINELGYVAGDIDSTSFDASGTEYNSLGFLFAGAITQPEQARDVMARLAFQCRSWFYWDSAGVAHLVIRDLYAAPDKAIGKERIVSGSLKLMRTATESIRNKISLHYDRDWTVEGRFGITDPELPEELREPEKGFKGLAQSSHSASDTAFGTRERAYYFDFVTGAAMAADLAGFYLTLQAYPRQVAAFRTYLDQYELERGDRIALTHTHFGLIAHDLELTDVSQIIGSGNAGRMDGIEFVAEGRAITDPAAWGRRLWGEHVFGGG